MTTSLTNLANKLGGEVKESSKPKSKTTTPKPKEKKGQESGVLNIIERHKNEDFGIEKGTSPISERNHNRLKRLSKATGVPLKKIQNGILSNFFDNYEAECIKLINEFENREF